VTYISSATTRNPEIDVKNIVGRRFSVVFAGLALATAAPAAEARLTVGDPAPKLQPAKWVQGEPVKAFDTNHVYILDFWDTWYGPCRASIPHLNDLSLKFKDLGLVTIGQDVWEKDDSAVARFVQDMSTQMTYRVTLDDKRRNTNGIMATSWMQAADQHSVPTTFVINRQGRIAWIGHPLNLNEYVLAQILTDKFDLGEFAAEYEQKRLVEQQRETLTRKLDDAIRRKDWDAADAAVVESEKNVPESLRFHYGNVRMQILLGRKDYAGAVALAESLSDRHRENAGFQNDIAWSLAVSEGLDERGLRVAEKIAERADTAAGGKLAAALDTLARIQFRLGKKPEAIASEQKAIAAADTDKVKRFLEANLAEYQQGRLPKAGE
jgi:thiol-disulfide isomerase/thioredoxin